MDFKNYNKNDIYYYILNMKIIKTELTSAQRSIDIMNPNVPLFGNRTKWLQYGEDNLYPDMLCNLLNISAIHKAIQYGKWELAQGQGLTWENIDQNDYKSLVNLNKLYYNPNPDEDLNEIFSKLLFDYIIFGGYCFEVIWSKDRNSIAQIHHVPFNYIRKGEPEGSVSNITHYWFSEDWSNYRRKGYVPTSIPAFNPSKNKNEPRQLVWYKDYSPNELYYPTPQYQPSIPYCLIDSEIGKYHLNDILNGLSPDFILAINSGEPLEDEKKIFEFDVKENFTGSEGKKIMITYSDDQDHAPQIIPIDKNDIHQRFITLNDAVVQQLMTANRLTSPMLMGIKTEGQLGGRSEMEDAFDIYYNTVISKIQKNVVNKLNKILHINNINTTFNVIKPQITTIQIPENILERIADVNEIRQMYGLDIKEGSENDKNIDE